MTNLPSTAEIIIIGGGVMGASTAYHLATRGQENVVLLEKEEFFGMGATGRCAGGIRYQFATPVNIQLSQASLPMLARFEEKIGQAIDYRAVGYLFLLTNEADLAVFRKNVALQHEMGVPTEWLSGDEIRRRLPMMRLDDVLAGTIHAKDGIADPNGVVMGYMSAAQQAGARVYTKAPVQDILVENGAVKGVVTPHGTVAAPLVINTAGPWAGHVAEMAGVELPITPLRRQMFTTTPLPQIPGDFPFVIDFAQSLYFHTEGEGLLIGMSNPDEEPGFKQQVDTAWEWRTVEAAIARIPLLEEAGLLSHWAGLYEVTPDAHPVFGETAVAGFHVCGGFSGHGFMHGPIAGKLMSEIILDGAAHTVDVSMLDPARFVEDRLIHEYNVI